MKKTTRSNSATLSKLIFVPRLTEPAFKELAKASQNGAFIGYSLIYHMPVFLDFNDAINPHALIVGMTGSGKTYFLKNMMLKMCSILENAIVIVDFTGEYREFALLFGDCPTGTRIDLESAAGITYFDLSQLSEQQKIAAADKILCVIVEKMRARSLEAKRQVFVLFDEAWKLLSASKSLETIIREGRKYGIGLFLASQLLEDSDIAITSNVSTLFFFRSQDKRTMETLMKNYGILETDAYAIQNLEIGSCFTIRLKRSEIREAFVIKKVLGIKFGAYTKILLGNRMQLEISVEKMHNFMVSICGPEKAREVMKLVTEKGSVDLWWLVERLLCYGVDRHLILRKLRELGVNDADSADAFAFALANSESYGSREPEAEFNN